MIFGRLTKYFLSEFMCTMLLVCLTCLACSSLENSIVPLSIAYGLIILILTHCFRPISGGYANPAVTLAMWFRGCLSMKRLIVYVVAELAGGVAGHCLANYMLGKSPSDPLCSFGPKAELSDFNLMAIEFFLTFLLILTWCTLWEYESEMPMEWYLAAVYTTVSMLGGFLTGGSTNPARTFAPSIFVDKNSKTNICIGSQLVAAVVTPLLWSFLDAWVS